MDEDIILTAKHRIDALSSVNDERERQNLLKRQGKFLFTCADEGLSNGDRFLVLAEELGEVGHELNEAIGRPTALDLKKLRTELVQVAAVCVAWCEAIDAGRASK